MEDWEFGAPADAWEKKAWAHVRYDDRSWHLSQRACNPDATAFELQAVADEALREVSRNEWSRSGCQMVIGNLAAHPNTPPHLFDRLIVASPFACRAFFRNPVGPFLLLENPAFVAHLHDAAQNALLNEAAARPEWVRLLAVGGAAHVSSRHNDLQGTARLHVAFAGEAHSRAEWEPEARAFYQAAAANTLDANEREWLADMVEVGLLPDWANGGLPFDAPTNSALVSAHPDVNRWLRFEHVPGSKEETYLLRKFISNLEFVPLLPRLAHDLRANASRADLRHTLRDAQRQPLKHRAYRDEVKEIILRHPAADAALIEEVSKSWYRPDILVCVPQTPQQMVGDLLRSESALIRRLARRHPNAPPNAREISRQAFVAMRERPSTDTGRPSDPLITLAAALHNETEREDVHWKGDDWRWTARFDAVWLAPLSDAPLIGDPKKRTGRNLLDHLSRDANRLVRAAAQTRLADPDYRFIL